MTERVDVHSHAAKIEKLLSLLPTKQREETARLLKQNDALSLQLLTNILFSEHGNRRIIALLLVAPGTLMVIVTVLARTHPIFAWYMDIPGVIGSLLLILSPWTSIPTALEKAAVETIVLSGDKHSIGGLLETLQLFHLPAALRKQSKQMLIHLLQNITAEDADLLTPAQQGQLSRNLNSIQRDNELELRLATLTALQHIGDQRCLGVLYTLASGEAATLTAQMVRQAARDCIEQMRFRLDFAPVSKISEYTDILIHQMQSEAIDYQIFATCMLALRQLLPQLDATNYYRILSERDRDRLYQLLILPAWLFSQNRYGINEVQEELLRTARRLVDTRALHAVRKIAFGQIPNPATTHLRARARETLPLLEAQVAREKESKTLLRGASAPAPPVQELLRAATPAESMAASNELLRASIPHSERAPVRAELSQEENTPALLSPRRNHHS